MPSPIKKRATTGSNERIPKKTRTAKFCQHCKMNSGPYTTHNTKECCKYGKDAKAAEAATGKPSLRRSPT